MQKTAIVTYKLSSSAKVTVAIYDNTDTLIKVLENSASKNSGSNLVSWDGKNTVGSMATSGTYKYLIAAAKIDNSASTSVTGSFTVKITNLTITSVSDAPELFGANGTRVSTIKFTMSKAANVTIKVYDTGNSLVKTIVDGNMNAGSNSVTWNGKTEKGVLVIDGKYTYKIDAQDSLGNKITQISGTINLDSTPPRISQPSATPIFIGL
jgi:flagellar hook assembly protein FlgD